jgi:hypothetical protein
VQCAARREVHARNDQGTTRTDPDLGAPLSRTDGTDPGVDPSGARFLQPVGEAEFIMSTTLDELTVDPWPVPAHQRPKRATCREARYSFSPSARLNL